MKKIVFLIVLFFIILIGGGAFLFLKKGGWIGRGYQEEAIKVILDKKEYQANDKIKLKIENQTEKRMCFSSCYPYYFERKNKTWSRYQYAECDYQDKIETCLAPYSEKAFEIELLSVLLSGTYRLAIPVCENCQPGDNFITNNILYSPPFEFKQSLSSK